MYVGGAITNLGELQPGSGAVVKALNASGQAVGYSGARPFVYAGGLMTDLAPGLAGQAYGINDRGDIVGQSSVNGLAFLFSHGVLTYLGGLRPELGSRAIGINSRGQILGDSSGNGLPFLYTDGVTIDLTAASGIPPDWDLHPTAITDSGLIVGTMHDPSKFYSGGARDHGFLLTPTTPARPTIATTPDSQSVTNGSTATFFVVAHGIPLPAYQWHVSSDGGASWSALSEGGLYAGTTTPLLTVAGVTGAQDGLQFRAVATNSAGSATTAAATLTVTTSAVAPTITAAPTNQVASVSGDARFTVAATGTTPLSYQWSRDGTPIPGAIQADLFITDVHTAHTGTYRVTVSNTAGSVTSAPVTLSVVVAVAPLTLQFGAERGPNGAVVTVTAPQEVSVNVMGVSAAWTATGDPPWLTLTPASGTGSGRFTAAVEAATLPAGATTASGTITLAVPSVGLTVTVPVTVTI